MRNDIPARHLKTLLLLSSLALFLALTACGAPQVPDDGPRATTATHQAPIFGGCIPQIETCNGVDDDCNGQIDDGIGRVLCRNEACNTIGYQICRGGQWSECSARGQSRETCNGVDDDCDGYVDEDLQKQCAGGCTPLSNGAWYCEGECTTGTQLCRNGQWTSCQNWQGPTPEVCDGKDNDCDGSIDNLVTCAPGYACHNSLCQKTCQSNNHCPSGEQCHDGFCKPSCQDSSDCPSGYQCDGGVCEPGCAVISCPSGKVCSNGQCQFPSCDSVTCPSGQTCVNGQCQEENCINTGCPSGQQCINGECTSDPCAGITCPSGQSCVAGQCK